MVCSTKDCGSHQKTLPLALVRELNSLLKMLPFLPKAYGGWAKGSYWDSIISLDWFPTANYFLRSVEATLLLSHSRDVHMASYKKCA